MVYIFLADGFEELEALTPVDVLRRAGIEVKTVGVTGMTVTSTHNVKVECDIPMSDVTDNAECVILPGGMPGAENLEKSEKVCKTVLNAYSSGKIVAAICAAPMVLGKLGILKGKTATCFTGFEKYLDGAFVKSVPVCRDENVITAWGAGAAFDFAFEILSALKGDNDAGRRMGEQMRCVR